MWVVLVTYNNKKVNVSQEAYKTYTEALVYLKSKEISQVNDYVFQDRENGIIYELKNVYIK